MIPACDLWGGTKRLHVKGRLSVKTLGHHRAWKEGKRNVLRKLKSQGACGPEEPDEGVVARETCPSKMSYGTEKNKGEAS